MRDTRGLHIHTSLAICRAGRVPSREAFRGSVITCSGNNERLILSSWLPPSSLSLSLSVFFRSLHPAPKASGPSRLIDLSFCCFLSSPASTSPLIVRPFVRRIHVLAALYLLLVVSVNTRSRAISICFECGFNFKRTSIAVGR